MKNRVASFFPIAAFIAGAFLLSQPLFAAPKPRIQTVAFEAYNYDFKGPDTIPAGLTAIGLINRGEEPHHIQLIRLENGKSADDFRKAMKESAIGLPSWAANAGGPNGASPGDRTEATVNLEPGNYILICVIPNQLGVPHVALGMLKPLTVTAGVASAPSEPKADLVLTESDYAFAPSKPFVSGKQTVKVVNNGTQPHEVVVVRLNPGASIKSFAAAFAPNASGPPPGRVMGGLTGIEKGAHAFFDVNLTPGHYGLICFFPDAKGVAHFAQGMALEFTIR